MVSFSNNIETPESVQERIQVAVYRRKLKAKTSTAKHSQNKMAISFVLNRKDVHSKHFVGAALRHVRKLSLQKVSSPRESTSRVAAALSLAANGKDALRKHQRMTVGDHSPIAN